MKHAAIGVLWTPNMQRVLAVTLRDRPGDYGMPGGKLEEGETPLQAMRREYFEETGITPGFCVPLLHAPGAAEGWMLDVFLVASADHYEAKSQEPGIGVEWIHPRELLDIECTYRAFYERHFHDIFGRC